MLRCVACCASVHSAEDENCAGPNVQVVPLPFVEQQPGQQCSAPQAPIEPVVMAAQAAAAAAPLQPFELRQLPFRAYAVVITARWGASSRQLVQTNFAKHAQPCIHPAGPRRFLGFMHAQECSAGTPTACVRPCTIRGGLALGHAQTLKLHPACISNIFAAAALCLQWLCVHSTTAAELEAAANQLLALCQAGLPAPVSYNVVMSSSFLMMVPRRQEMCGPAAIK